MTISTQTHYLKIAKNVCCGIYHGEIVKISIKDHLFSQILFSRFFSSCTVVAQSYHLIFRVDFIWNFSRPYCVAPQLVFIPHHLFCISVHANPHGKSIAFNTLPSCFSFIFLQVPSCGDEKLPRGKEISTSR